MGTLFNEPERKYFDIDFKYVKSDCENIKKIAKETGMSVTDVIEVNKIKTQNRSIDCYVANGDIHDEQMSGFGELFKSFNSKLDDLIELLESKINEE